MGKLKTVHSVKDRIHVTGTGKLIGHRAGRRHLLTGRRSKLKRQLRRPQTIAAVDTRNIRTLIPYA